MKKVICYYIVFIATLFLNTMPIHGNVMITQVLYDSPLNEQITIQPATNGEFVELYNSAATAISLAGWSLRGGGKTEKYEFTTGATIPANGYLAVAYRHNASPSFVLDSLIEVPQGYNVVYQRKIILSNTGEGLALYNADGIRVDTMRYTSGQAVNADSLELAQCKSVQRDNYTSNQNGCGVYNLQDWDAGMVVLGQIIPQQVWLPDADYYGPQTALPNGSAYVVSISARSSIDSISSVNGQINLNGGGQAQVGVTWCNPLGKPTISVARRQTPDGKNLATLTEYVANRTTREWMPIPVDVDDSIEANMIKNHSSVFYSDSKAYYGTTREVVYQGRVTASTQPGADYQGHPATYTYEVNTANEVPYWRVTTNGATKYGCYPAGALRKTTHTDEDGKITEMYTDMNDRTILLRIAGEAETYSIYDDLGRLRYVLPHPAAVAANNAGSFSDNTQQIEQYAYIYRYDNRARCIYKKQPGCEPLYMVYDRLGNQVMSQDGNQRQRGHYWTVARYTLDGHLAFTCEVLAANSDLDAQVSLWANATAFTSFVAGTESSVFDNIGYEDSLFVGQVTKPLVVYYYDNYDFLNLLPSDIQSALAYSALSGYGEKYMNATGLQTGKRVYSLEDSTYTISAVYYDRDGRPIQQRSTMWNGEYDVKWWAYDFDGSVRKSLKQMQDMTESYTYEYDMAGRLQQTKYSLNGSDPLTLSENTYDALGRMVTRHRHDNTDTVTFAYNLQGKTTRIAGRGFEENITFVQNGHGYNGTISAATVSQGGVTQSWRYNYDNYNRLTAAQLITGETVKNAETFTYDPLGNILTLNRWNGDGQIDDLTYAYSGNQLIAVTDEAGEQSLYDVKEYNNLADEENELLYDANGNIIADFDRNICTIQYNLLNLPAIIQFCDGNSIRNVYNAEGMKLSSTYLTLPETMVIPVGTVLPVGDMPQGAHVLVRQYFGHVDKTFSDSTMEYVIHHAEGYVTCDSLYDSPAWHYLYHDHLGNNMVVWNATADTVVQRMFYYPSGLPMAVSIGQGAQPYKYNGKEYDEMHGYDVYDYGFRGYYASIARFTSIDPLCERTPWQSPYCYASNNFTNEIDWMGLFGSGGFASNNIGRPQCIIIDAEGFIKDVIDDGDMRIYLDEDGNWTPDKGKDGLIVVGWMLAPIEVYQQRYLSAKARNEKVKVFGFYYGQWTFSISCSIGAQLGIAIPFPKMLKKVFKNLDDVSLTINLLSVELFELSWNYIEGFFLDYIGENNQTKVTQELSLIVFSLNQEFMIDSFTAEFIQGTDNFSVSSVVPIFNSKKLDNMPWKYSYSKAFGIGISLNISGTWYYEQK